MSTFFCFARNRPASGSHHDDSAACEALFAASLGAVFAVTLAAACAAGEALPPVGRLLVPGLRMENGYAKHVDENCSATLVGPAAGGDSPWILTAWHCLEYYRDLTRPILFELGDQTLQARAIVSGGAMTEDWALMRLQRPLPGAVSIAPSDMPAGTPLQMVGYSRREDGQRAPLSWDADCAVTGEAGRDLSSDCHARRGASGGGVFHAESGALLGVISRGDSRNLSIFVPVTGFFGRVSPYLATTPDRRE